MRRSRARRGALLVSRWGGALALVATAWLTLGAATAAQAAGADRDDARITARLRAVFSHVADLRSVEVDVHAGVVRLSGQVVSSEARREADEIARSTAGVVAVENDITEVRNVGRRLRPALDKLLARLAEFVAILPLLVIAGVVVVLFALLAHAASSWERPYLRLSRNRFVRDLLRQLVRVVIFLVGVVVALEVLDATALIGAVLGTAGVVGLAVGFAFRDLVENYIASILLSLRQPFAPNDHVVIEGHEGKVIRLTSRATVLMTLDGNHLRMPNSTVFKGVILNYSRNPLRRFDFAVNVGVGEDLGEAQKIGCEVLAGLPGIDHGEEPFARVEALGDSSVALRFFAWVDQRRADFGKVGSEGIRRLKEAFDGAGIEMPEPIFRVRMGEEAREEAPPRPAPAEPRDVAVDRHLESQIAADRAASSEEDLLDPAAPRE